MLQTLSFSQLQWVTMSGQVESTISDWGHARGASRHPYYGFSYNDRWDNSDDLG